MTKRVKLFLISAMVCLMAVATVFLTLNANVANASQKTLTGTKGQAEVTEEVNLDTFEVVDSASIRTESPSGIRFLTTVSKAQVSNLPDNAVFGTLLLPTELLGSAPLTLETQKVANVKAITYSESGDNYQYLTSLVGQKVADGNYEDFNEAFYGKEISARSYVTYTYGSGTVKTVYTNTVSYSVEQTARNLLAKASELQLSQDEIPTLKAIATKNAIKATTLKTAQVFEASSVVESVVNVDIPLSAGITADDVTGVYGENYVSFAKVDSDTIAITLKDATVRGDVSFMVFTADATILVDVCLADQVIDDATEFTAMLTSRLGTVAPADAGKYIVLGADVAVGNTRTETGKNKGFFDTFDGRGHVISDTWTYGVFGIVNGGVVKNTIFKNSVIREEVVSGVGGPYGVIAIQASNGAIIENNVVIDPHIHTNATSSVGYGFLVGQTFTNTTIIRNNVVIDQVAAPGKTFYTGTKYDASASNSYLSLFIGVARASYDPNYAVAQGRFVGNYAISANGYSGSRTQLSSGAPDGANSIYNDTIATTGKGLLDLGFNASNYSLFDVDEWGAVSILDRTLIEAEAIEVTEEVAIGKQATITVDAIANKTVSKITIADKEVAFTQAGNKITFSADATATLDSGVDLEMIITADVKYRASITVYNEIASKEDYEKMMVGVVTGTGSSAIRAIDGYYVQTADIDLGTQIYQYPFLSNASGTAISTQFIGVYDGQGYTITGGKTSGLFGCIAGTIKNVVLKDTVIHAVSGADRGGALCNSLQGTGAIDNIYVIGATVTSTNDRAEAFLVGQQYTASSSITNCLVVDTGTSKTENVTALVGHQGAGSITNTYAITANGYNAVWSVQANVAKYDSCIATSYNAFTTAAGANLANFKLLKTDASGNVTVGNGNVVTTIYTAQT